MVLLCGLCLVFRVAASVRKDENVAKLERCEGKLSIEAMGVSEHDGHYWCPSCVRFFQSARFVRDLQRCQEEAAVVVRWYEIFEDCVRLQKVLEIR